jgi:hypothetical protein
MVAPASGAGILGVYGMALFELLERRGCDVRLVDARQAARLPGRPKSDAKDCQWLRRLHSYGLLAAAFRPADQVVVLRGYLRQRQMLLTYASQHVQHIQKATGGRRSSRPSRAASTTRRLHWVPGGPRCRREDSAREPRLTPGGGCWPW